MLLKPVAQIAVSKVGYVWRGQKLLAVWPDNPTDDDNLPPRPSEKERLAVGLDRAYDPFEAEPGLFLRFARLALTKDAILEFATAYGCLGIPSLRNWKKTIAAMNAAVELWKGVKERDQKRLSNHVKWRGSRLEIISPLGKGFVWSAKFFDVPQVQDPTYPGLQPLGRYCRGELLRPAEDLLGWLLRLGRFPVGSIKPRQTESGHYELQLTIPRLNDVLWTQWVGAVCGNQVFRYCASCEKPIRITSTETRSDRLYCAGACNQRAYRQRIKDARRMRKEGKHLREIAKALGTDVATVKKWVAET